MDNDVLILRFQAPAGKPTTVKPVMLAEFVDRLEGVFATLGPPEGNEHVPWLQLHIIASPRPACIEFVLSGALYVETINVFAPEMQARAQDVLETARDWVSFGLEVLGARYGIVEAFKRREHPTPPAIASDSVPTTRQLAILVTSTTLSTERGQRVMADLIGFSSGLGYERVEIQFRDEPPINLVVESETWDDALSRGRFFSRTSPLPKGAGPFDFKITSDFGLKAKWKGAPYPAIIGKFDGKSYLLVWGSTRPVPIPGDTVSVHGYFSPNSEEVSVTEANPMFSEMVGKIESAFFVEKKVTIIAD